MPITYVRKSTLATANANTVTVTTPTVSTDDVMVFHVASDGSRTIVDDSVELTEVHQGSQGAVTHAVFYYVVDGGENATYTFSNGGNKEVWECYITVWSGVDTTTPIDVKNTAVNTGTGTSPQALTEDTATDGAMVIAVAAHDREDGTYSPPGTYVEAYDDIGSGGANGCTFTLAYEVKATAGTIGNLTFTQTDSDEWVASLFALKPSGGTVHSLDGTSTGLSNVPNSGIDLAMKISAQSDGLGNVPSAGVSLTLKIDVQSDAQSDVPNSTMGIDKNLSGQVDGQSDLPSSNIEMIWGLAGQSDGGSTTVVDLDILMKIGGQSDGLSSTPSSTLGVVYVVTGQSDGLSNTTIDLGVSYSVNGGITGQSNVPDSTITISKNLSGQSDGQANLPDSEIELLMKVAGQADGQSDIPSSTLGVVYSVTGQSDGLCSTVVELGVTYSVNGQVDGQSDVPSSSMGLVRGLAGQADGLCGVTGSLTVTSGGVNLDGTSDGVSSVTSSMVVSYGMTGQSDGTVALTGSLSVAGSGISVEVSGKIRFTGDGEFQVRLTNRTGSGAVRGELVKADAANDNSFVLTGIDDAEYMGVVGEDGVSDGSETWITIGGKAQILLKDSTASVRGNWVKTSDVAGRADATAASPPGGGISQLDEHMQEVGNTVESKSAGTDVLAWVVLR